MKKRQPLSDIAVYESLREATREVLDTLSQAESKVLRLRFGLGTAAPASPKEIADLLKIPVEVVESIEQKALRKLRHPVQSTVLRSFLEAPPEFVEPTLAEVRSVIEQVRELTPDLIFHLRRNASDIACVHWEVFEHLVAELLASIGFEEVALVGRNKSTSADIFAAWKVGPLGSKIRYFVEVKHTKDKLGVEVVDHVYGAMVAERPKLGWHAALIVSIHGLRDLKKYSHDNLVNRGIELKDKNDLIRWLGDYEPNGGGLWVPKQQRDIPFMM